MKKIIFVTFATTDEWLYSCAIPLKNSFKYFHPDEEFKIFEPQETNALFKAKKVGLWSGKLSLASTLWDEYEQIVIMDSDQIVTGTLDAILTQPCQVSAPRICSDHGSVHTVIENPSHWWDIPGKVTVNQYMNAGIISIRGKEIWKKCLELPCVFPEWDQTIINTLGYKYGYSNQQLDPIKNNDYYGVANSWGINHAWESWYNIELFYGKLYLKNKFNVYKQVKVLHKAGAGIEGPCGDKFPSNLFKHEVFEFLKRIRS